MRGRGEAEAQGHFTIGAVFGNVFVETRNHSVPYLATLGTLRHIRHLG